MNDIVLSGISKSFDGKMVLHDVTAEIAAGETVCIRGRSGIGKTTLLRIIAGLIEPDSGTVSGIPGKIAFVFQEDRLSEEFSAVSNIRLVTGRSMSSEQIKKNLAELELLDSALFPVKDLSGGMKRRVALARAVCADPELLILDEPFKGLDPELKLKVIEYIKRHSAGKTVICVTHDHSETELMGGRVINLDAR